MDFNNNILITNDIENKTIRLNVGGMIYQLLKTTLLKKIKIPLTNDYYPNHNLYLLVKENDNLKNQTIFINRSPKYFDIILTFFRCEIYEFLQFFHFSNTNKYEILKESEFYNLIGLKNLIILNLKNAFLEIKFIHSNILTNDQFNFLFNFCRFEDSSKFKLIYRGSKNGFSASEFHKNCDGNKETLTIILSENNNIFGGYINGNWSANNILKENNRFGTDNTSFIFSLINKYNEPIILKCIESSQAYYKSSNRLISFGMSDILITTNCNINKTSQSNLGFSYKHPNFKRGSKESQSFLAGTQNFQVKEIEVYELND
jgi:hypothetical protein